MNKMSISAKLPFEVFDLKGDGYHLLLDAKLRRRTYKLVLDTGASKSVFDKKTLEKQIGMEHIFETGALSTGLGVMDMPSQLASIPKMTIGGMVVLRFEVAVLDLGTIVHTYSLLMKKPVLGVLGCDFLVQKGAVIDFSKKHILLH